MSNYHRVSTSAEVYAVIRAKHSDELKAFSSFSDPDGERNGGTRGCMQTAFGFNDADFPFIEVKTTWDIEAGSDKRLNLHHQYWLCIPIKGDE